MNGGGLFNNGFFRAYIAICLGALIYYLVCRIRAVDWTEFGRKILSAVELMAYGAAFLLLILCQSDHYMDSSHRYVVTVLLAVGIALSFSGVTATSSLGDWRISRYLGKLSLSLCLSHSLVIELFYRRYEHPEEHALLFFGVALVWSVIFQAAVDMFVSAGGRFADQLKKKAVKAADGG